jgi:hypothetical protein
VDQIEDGRKRVRTELMSFKESVSENLDAVEAKIAADRMLAGDRPLSAGTMYIWSTLEELEKGQSTNVERLHGHETILTLELLDAKKGQALIDARLQAMMKGDLGMALARLHMRLKTLETSPQLGQGTRASATAFTHTAMAGLEDRASRGWDLRARLSQQDGRLSKLEANRTTLHPN